MSTEPDILASMRPASAAHVRLAAAVLSAQENGLEPSTIREIIEELLPPDGTGKKPLPEAPRCGGGGVLGELEAERRLRRSFATQRDEAWAKLAKVSRALGPEGAAADVGAARAALDGRCSNPRCGESFPGKVTLKHDGGDIWTAPCPDCKPEAESVDAEEQITVTFDRCWISGLLFTLNEAVTPPYCEDVRHLAALRIQAALEPAPEQSHAKEGKTDG